MLEIILDWFFYNLLGLEASSHWVKSLYFFIYDSIKILLLLFLLILVMGFIRTYIPQKKIKKWIGKGKAGISNLIASSFGAVTPFCSCSSIPLFISFTEIGVPLGVAFSFLITSP